MKLSWKSTLTALGLLCMAAPQARSQLDSRPIVQSASVVGAGAVHTTNGAYTVRATLAQTAIGFLNTGSNAAALGFWHPLSRTTGGTRPEQPTAGGELLNVQASPNPFAGSTQIALKIPGNRYVSLVLYNLIGQPVKTLLNNERREGDYNLTLNADDLPSGRYTLILDAGDERRTVSLLLAR